MQEKCPAPSWLFSEVDQGTSFLSTFSLFSREHCDPTSLQDKHGCWVVQQLLQRVPAELHAFLAFELRGKVLACSQHLHGNFVLQRCVELLSHNDVGFIVEELKNHAVDAASHIYSCRVLQRIIEHCPHDSPGMTELLDNLLISSERLQKLVMDP